MTRGFPRSVLAAIFVLSACGSQTPSADKTSPTPSPSDSISPTSGQTSGPSCQGNWIKPGKSCVFNLAGSSLTIGGSAYSKNASQGDAEFRISVEVNGRDPGWNCAGMTTTEVPGDASPRPGETWAGCDDDFEVPADLVGAEATCRVTGAPGGDFSCTSF